MLAFGAKLALYRHGLIVPEDVSLAGVDDQVESRHMTPPLTSVRQPAIAMGIDAGIAMAAMLSQKQHSFMVPAIEIVNWESSVKLG